MMELGLGRDGPINAPADGFNPVGFSKSAVSSRPELL